MANEKNLIPFTSDQSHDEAVKNGKKGGVASGAARRRRKTMRQTLNGLPLQGIFAASRLVPKVLYISLGGLHHVISRLPQVWADIHRASGHGQGQQRPHLPGLRDAGGAGETHRLW